MFDDEKIKLIRTMPEGDSIVIIWVQILCLAGKINDNGAVYMGQNLAYSDEMLATILGHPLNIMRVALQTLEQFEMIEVDEGGEIEIVNWEKHQNIDGMERIRKQNRERKKRFDLRKKIEQLGYDPNAENVPYEVEKLEEYVEKIEKLSSNAIETFGNVTEENNNHKTDKSEQEPHNNSDNVSSDGGNVTVTSGNATDKTRIEERREEKNREEKKESSSKEKNAGGGSEKNIETFSIFEKLWMFPNLVQKETLEEFIDLYGDDLVVAAIKIAGSKDVIKGKAINFIESVLKEWENNNVKTLEQAREYERNRKTKKKSYNNQKQPVQKEKLPDWVNNEQGTSKDDEVLDDTETEKRLERLKRLREEKGLSDE